VSRSIALGRRWTQLAPRVQHYLPALSIAGALVGAGQVLGWSMRGAWPFHDAVNIWAASDRLLRGEPVYTGVVGEFLVYVYAPVVAVLTTPFTLVSPEAFTLLVTIGNVLALRYIAGSWLVAGLLAWLPWTPRAIVTGNVDLMMAAVMLASLRGIHGSGYASAVFAAVKFSPVLAVTRWREFALGLAFLAALSVPVLHLYPEWVATLRLSLGASTDTIPLLARAPFVVALLLVRRPWSIAAAAALATPAFYMHSWVLVYPAVRLWMERPAREDRPLNDVTTSARPAPG
jgi:hypothetical protein